MIKFFRRIRKKLLIQNQAGKYLLYAIGEIILVVIGILIALWINNLNETKKVRKNEIVLLQGLMGELQFDILQIESNISKSMERLDRLELVMNSLKSPESLEKNDFINKSFEFAIDNYFRCNSGIFDEAVSSGKMSYIQNPKLLQHVFDYYRNAKESRIDGTSQQITDQLITPLLAELILMNPEAFNWLGMEVNEVIELETLDLNTLPSNRNFWKMSLLKFASNKEQIMRWTFLKNDAEALKTEIEIELKHLTD